MVDEAAAKATLRTTVQRMRGQADPAAILTASRRAADLLATIHGIQRARTVLLHEPVPGDLDPRPLADRLIARGARVLLLARDQDRPVVVAPGRAHLAEAHLEVDDLDGVEVVVLPGIAFDLDGGRLGTGREQWSRLLARVDDGALRVGIARTTQLVPRVPREPDDVVVDVVVTDRGVHHTGARLGPRDA